MKLPFTIRCVKSNIVGTPLHIFVKVICRDYFPWEFAAVLAFCRWNSPQLFAVRICCGYFPWVCFVHVSKPFLCVNKSFFFVIKFVLIESRPFLYVSKIFFIYDNFFINSVSFCYCPDSYGPLYLRKSSGHVLTFNERQRTSKYFESALV